MAGELILVVDDSKENREFIIDYVLKPNNYRSLEARDGVECLELARREAPDLILLDLQMPRLDGVGVLDTLRRENLAIPVILMTFHGSEEIAVEVFRMGVRDYVKKPYTPEEMLQAIETSLTETRLRKEKDALTARLLNANRELHSRIKELNTLYSVGKSVTALLDTPQLLARIVEAATVVTNAEQGSLMLLDNDRLVLRAVKRRSDPHAYPVAEEISQDRLAERAVAFRKPIVLTPQDLARLRSKNPAAPSAVMYVPMFVGERPIGVLSIENVSPNARGFTDHDGALLSALGDYAAIGIENARNFNLLKESREGEKSTIRSAFERFVAPSVVERVLPTPDDMVPGGARREISVLFADIQSFLPTNEQADPGQVLELLNRYFTLVTEVIFEHEGTLDIHLGDAAMAFFNAPEDQDDHPYRAAEAALALQAGVADLNAQYGMNKPGFAIGLALGEAIVGNIGTPRALSYTAVGHAVTLARRLQEHAEPGQILAAEDLIARLGEDAEAQRLGELTVKGRDPIVFYELRDLA